MNFRKTGSCSGLLFVLSCCLTLLAPLSGTALKAQGTSPSTEEPQARSQRIHEILREAKYYAPADAKTRLALEEVARRPVHSFVDFEKQCADLQTNLAQSDVMEKRKRHMFAELRYEFRDDPKVQQIFKLLTQIEDVSDRTEPIWRGMIACSKSLARSAQSKQSEYQATCIDPAHQQLVLLQPDMAKSVRELQEELQKYGSTLPPDILQLMGQ
jgi:hypothetical protein